MNVQCAAMAVPPTPSGFQTALSPAWQRRQANSTPFNSVRSVALTRPGAVRTWRPRVVSRRCCHDPFHRRHSHCPVVATLAGFCRPAGRCVPSAAGFLHRQCRPAVHGPGAAGDAGADRVGDLRLCGHLCGVSDYGWAPGRPVRSPPGVSGGHGRLRDGVADLWAGGLASGADRGAGAAGAERRRHGAAGVGIHPCPVSRAGALTGAGGLWSGTGLCRRARPGTGRRADCNRPVRAAVAGDLSDQSSHRGRRFPRRHALLAGHPQRDAGVAGSPRRTALRPDAGFAGGAAGTGPRAGLAVVAVPDAAGRAPGRRGLLAS